MKQLSFREMEGINGGLEANANGSTSSNGAAAIICGLGFAQLGFWNGLALGLGGVSLGVTLGVALAIDTVGAVVCSQAG